MFNDNNINWMGNNVFNPSAPRQPYYPPAQEMPAEREEEVVMPQSRMPAEEDMDEQMMRQGPPPITDVMYVPGYLMTLIGKKVRAEFTPGNNFYLDKAGILRKVGVNYFVLEDVTGSMVMCDLYSVRFVTSI